MSAPAEEALNENTIGAFVRNQVRACDTKGAPSLLGHDPDKPLVPIASAVQYSDHGQFTHKQSIVLSVELLRCFVVHILTESPLVRNLSSLEIEG